MSWKGDVIATRCARAGDVVSLGDDATSLAPLPHDVIGTRAIAVADVEGGPHVRVPEGKVASVRAASGTMRLVSGPAREALALDEEATLLFGSFEVVVSAQGEPSRSKRRLAGGAWAHTAFVAAIHAGLLFLGSRAALASQTESAPDANVDAMRAYLAAADERSSAPDAIREGDGGKKTEAKADGRAGNGKTGGGERHEGDAGKAGATTSRAHQGHWGATAKDAKSTSLTAAEAVADARSFGMAGVLAALNGDDSQRDSAGVPVRGADSPWGSADAFAAVGGMLGHAVGESEGMGGLALTGIGEGGGGDGFGVGLGGIGTIGHTDGLAGIGTGGAGTAARGFGFGTGFGHGRHKVREPSWRSWGCCVGVSGRLPPEIIRRVIRSNFGRFRACYEDGLKRNPSLEGRVTTNFVIGRDGAVSNVSDGGSDIGDKAVAACVIRAFYSLSFPQPEDGIVTVVYPITFSPVVDSTPKKPFKFTPGE
ncbi:MAG: AgmX/PglI C-terminal domain-containing protein [Polyangiaceae bacterium]